MGILVNLIYEGLTTLNCCRETDIIGSASPPASLCKNAKLLEEGTGTNLKLLNIDETQSAEKCGMLYIKAITVTSIFLLCITLYYIFIILITFFSKITFFRSWDIN